MRFYAIGDIHGQLEMLKAAHARIARDREETGDADRAGRPPGRPHRPRPRQPRRDRLPDRRVKRRRALDRAARQPRPAPARHPRRQGGERRRLAGTPHRRHRNARLLRREDGRLPQPPRHPRRRPRHDPRRAPPLPRGPARFSTRRPICSSFTRGSGPGCPSRCRILRICSGFAAEFLEDPRDHGPLIVHGHTPGERPEHRGNRVNLDSGAGFGRPLTAAIFEGRDCWVLGEEGRERLAP